MIPFFLLFAFFLSENPVVSLQSVIGQLFSAEGIVNESNFRQWPTN